MTGKASGSRPGNSGGNAGATSFKRRLFALLVVTAVLFSLVVVRMGQLQVVGADTYTNIGESQRIREIKLPASRGAMFDRNGNPLAISIPQKTVWADPKLITDPYRTAALLGPVLGQEIGPLTQSLQKPGRFVYLKRKVTDDVAERVKALKLDGIELMNEPKRFHPEDELLGSVIGKVGIDEEGLSGLEVQYSDVLAGEAGEMLVEQDPSGRDIPGGVRNEKEPVPGNDLVLTIDRDLQYKAHQALSAEIEKSNARGGIAATMDTATGEVLALANLAVPNGGRGTPVAQAPSNMALTNAYEPGSVNKLITISGALEEGLVTPQSEMVVGNQMTIGNAVFKEHEEHAVEAWNTAEIVTNSSNTGSIMIGQKLGKERLDRYMRDFGFGSSTGLEFPGETRGLMLDTGDYSGSSLPSIAIGQGVAVTAMQMLAAYNTIANEGTYVAPKLVKATIDDDGNAKPTEPSVTRRVVSPQTANQMSSMLKEVVRVGTGTEAQIDGYEVAGKTGTARKPRVDGPGYQAGAYVSSFAGFVPAEKPRLTTIVMLDQPTPIYGGLVAAPVFGDISRYGLQQLQVPPIAGDAANHGVPFVDAETASGVGEAGAPAPEAEAATPENGNTTPSSSTSSTSSTAPSAQSARRTTTTTQAESRFGN